GWTRGRRAWSAGSRGGRRGPGAGSRRGARGGRRGGRRGAGDDDPERLAREPPPARVHEEAAAIAPTRVERPDLPEVACDPSGGLGADRHEPLFLALARADHVPGL